MLSLLLSALQSSVKGLGLSLCLLASSVWAHEMVPTYPELKPAHVQGLMKAELVLFNKREEVEYYAVGVFTEDWMPVPFATNSRLININYLERVAFDVYIRNEDATRATYVCSISKLRASDSPATPISSRICSKLRMIGI